jgi:hypothetical protein
LWGDLESQNLKCNTATNDGLQLFSVSDIYLPLFRKEPLQPPMVCHLSRCSISIHLYLGKSNAVDAHDAKSGMTKVQVSAMPSYGVISENTE